MNYQRALDIVFGLTLLILVYLAIVGFPAVYAAPLPKAQEDGTCVEFASAGTLAQYHCVDPNGNEYDTNAVGFMIAVGN